MRSYIGQTYITERNFFLVNYTAELFTVATFKTMVYSIKIGGEVLKVLLEDDQGRFRIIFVNSIQEGAVEVTYMKNIFSNRIELCSFNTPYVCI